MPQIATVGLVGGFWEDGAIGAREEPAVFRRNTRALSVLRDSCPVIRFALADVAIMPETPLEAQTVMDSAVEAIGAARRRRQRSNGGGNL